MGGITAPFPWSWCTQGLVCALRGSLEGTGFDFNVIAPLLPSHCGFSFVLDVGYLFLVRSNSLPLVVVQQLVAILVFSQEIERTSLNPTILILLIPGGGCTVLRAAIFDGIRDLGGFHLGKKEKESLYIICPYSKVHTLCTEQQGLLFIFSKATALSHRVVPKRSL